MEEKEDSNNHCCSYVRLVCVCVFVSVFIVFWHVPSVLTLVCQKVAEFLKQ